jgi:ribosome biogenesis GTPase
VTDDLRRLTPDLASLGWDRELDQWADPLIADDEAPEAEGLRRGRIARVSRGFSLVFTGGDAVLAASASIRGQLATEPATGDFVLVGQPETGDDESRTADAAVVSDATAVTDADQESDDELDEEDEGLATTEVAVLEAIAPRRSALRRRASGRHPEAQVLAANIDLVFVMHSLDSDVNLRRIERQLVVAWDSQATPVVILTKADLDDEADAAVEAVAAIAPSVEVMATSVTSGRNLDRVADLLKGRTAAMLGLSGIGKSSLVNALSGGVVQRTGEVRTTDRRGRHTTVTRDLIPLPAGGLLIDTPGVREIGLWQAHEGLEQAFPEVAEAVARCRFADCKHDSEPGCAVRAEIEAGTVERRRLDHWNDLQAELTLQDEQLEEWARRAESRDRAEAERRRDDERSNTKRRSRSDSRRKQAGKKRKRR